MTISIPQNIIDLVNSHNYDVRVSNYGRWFDQKCTPNVLSFVSDCLVVFLENNPDVSQFRVVDVWHSEYSRENAMGSFGKPDPLNRLARREYDKFYGQPLLMLAYAGVLKLIKKGNRNVFEVVDRNILMYIAMRDRNAVDFLYAYVDKVLLDSGLKNSFDRFFTTQSQEEYCVLKDNFENFLHENTPIEGHLECGRIFTKVVNVLAYAKEKRGSVKGRISETNITLPMLMYKGENFRDLYTNKPRGMTRAEYQASLINQNQGGNSVSSAFSVYQTNRAKRYVRTYNIRFNDNISEIKNYSRDTDEASYIHHIFPRSQYPEISHYLENLIAITPNQHWNKAHPHGNTQRIDRSFQHLLILGKIDTIRQDYVEKRGVYDFTKFMVVLDTGLDVDVFEGIDYLDFDEVIKQLNLIYFDLEDAE